MLSPSYIRLNLHVAVSLYCWKIIVTVQSQYHEPVLIVVATLAMKAGSLLLMQQVVEGGSVIQLVSSWQLSDTYRI